MDINTCQQEFINLSDTLPTLEKQTLYTPPETVEEFQNSSIDTDGYRCYACHDTGWVISWAIARIIPNYSYHTDKYCVCDRLDTCREKIPDVIYELDLFDTRFNKDLLNKIHDLNKLNWRKSTLGKAKMIQTKINNFVNNY